MSRKIGAGELSAQLEAVRAATQRLMADIEAERAKNALLAASLKNQDEEMASLRGKNETERNEVVARNVQLIDELEAVKAQLQAAGAAAKNEIDALKRELTETVAARDWLSEQSEKLKGWTVARDSAAAAVHATVMLTINQIAAAGLAELGRPMSSIKRDLKEIVRLSSPPPGQESSPS